jgi:hypothetical protein
MVSSGVSMRLTPPASATSHSPLRRACTARCTATNDDEQAVSSDTAGPWAPSTYDSRPAAMLRALPVVVYVSICSGSASSRRM